MESKRLSRLLGFVAYVGLALVLISILGQAYHLFLLAIPGFLLLIIGGFGLIGVAHRESMRRVASPPTLPPPTFTGFPIVGHPNLTGFAPLPPPPLEGVTTPLVQATDLRTDRKFDLSTEYRQYRKQMRVPVLMRMGLYAFLIGLGGWAAGEGLWFGSISGVILGSLFIALGGVLMVVVRGIGRGVDWLMVGPSGITAHLRPTTLVAFPWASPRFGIRITETSKEANQVLRPGQDRATYRFFTGRGSGMGGGARVLTEIPAECARLILSHAQSHGLTISDRMEGPPGTVSQRRVYRITSTGPFGG
ncbi:MAG: hypothetical protein ACREDK_07515 [Thermoplasmata archaeon]